MPRDEDVVIATVMLVPSPPAGVWRRVTLALALCLLTPRSTVAGQAAAPTAQPANDPKPAPLFQLFPPEPLEVTTIAGQGAIPFRLRIVGETTAPPASLVVTAPIGGGRALPDGAVTLEADRVERVGVERFQVVTLTVQVPGGLPGGAVYKGQVLVPGGPHLPFTITERGGSDVEILTDKITLILGFFQSPTVRVAIRNKGTTPAAISTITASLTDAPSGRLVQSMATTLPAPLPAGFVTEVELPVPWPAVAGVYAGPLALTVGSQRVTVPFSVTTRGPYSWLLLPPVSFVAVFLLAAGLSYKLEGWFGEGGGLIRAETIVALARTEKTLELLASNLRARADAHPILRALPPIAVQLVQDAAAAADARLERFGGLPPEVALPKARVAQSAGHLLATLLDATLPALVADDTVLGTVDAGIAALAWPTDQAGLTKFEADARLVFDAAETLLRARLPAADGGGAAGAPSFETPTDPVEAADAALDAIKRMALLQRGVIVVVALLTAYQTFYATNAAFGRFGDYIAVFVWALGLTQAGTQLLSRARAKTT